VLDRARVPGGTTPPSHFKKRLLEVVKYVRCDEHNVDMRVGIWTQEWFLEDSENRALARRVQVFTVPSRLAST
jgi:hypothetical protein